MPGGAVITGTADTSRIEAPVTVKAYLICAFAAFGGIFFGYDTGVCIFALIQSFLIYMSLLVGTVIRGTSAEDINLQPLYPQIDFMESFGCVFC